MSGAVELLACPICGSDDIYGDHGTNRAYCNGCDAEGILDLWNTRAPDPAVAVLEAEVARLREVLQHWIDWLVDGAQTGSQLSKASIETVRLMATLPVPSEKEAG